MINSTSRQQFAAAAVAALAILAFCAPAYALVTTGGVDPVSGMTRIASYALVLAGIVIPCICAFKGVQAVAEGRHLMPYIGSAIGGMVLCFGGSFLLTQYGVT